MLVVAMSLYCCSSALLMYMSIQVLKESEIKWVKLKQNWRYVSWLAACSCQKKNPPHHANEAEHSTRENKSWTSELSKTDLFRRGFIEHKQIWSRHNLIAYSTELYLLLFHNLKNNLLLFHLAKYNTCSTCQKMIMHAELLTDIALLYLLSRTYE
jgi:hypothetical protein